MAKIKTAKEKLYDKLIVLPVNQWFRISNREDFEKLTKQVKNFIDNDEPFEFSNDYTKIRRIYYAGDRRFEPKNPIKLGAGENIG